MNKQSFNERESLELISRMILSTKERVELGNGNIFLLYGYGASALALTIFLLQKITEQPYWSSLWFLMFVPTLILKLREKDQQQDVVTYTDKALISVWQIIGGMFGLSALVILGVYAFGYGLLFSLMLPLSLIYVAIGTSITGVILDEKWLKYTPLVGLPISVIMMTPAHLQGTFNPYFTLLFGLGMFLMMVIPGHLLNLNRKKHV